MPRAACGFRFSRAAWPVSLGRLRSFGYRAESVSVDTPRVVPDPLLATVSAPTSVTKPTLGVAYRMLTVQVLPAANGVVEEQVLPVIE